MASLKNDTAENGQGFRFRYVFYIAAVLLMVLAIVSHSPGDMAVIEGGSDAQIENWIGIIGAQISRLLFYLYGIAVYPIMIVLLLCLVRSFMPFPMKRRGYVGSLIAVIIGITILMGMFPLDFCRYTEMLGIGHSKAPALALSGGVIGQQLAAPETNYLAAGIIRRYIGTVGTAIVGTVCLLTGAVFIFLADWKSVFFQLFVHADTLIKEREEKKKREDEEKAKDSPATADADMPSPPEKKKKDKVKEPEAVTAPTAPPSPEKTEETAKQEKEAEILDNESPLNTAKEETKAEEDVVYYGTRKGGKVVAKQLDKPVKEISQEVSAREEKPEAPAPQIITPTPAPVSKAFEEEPRERKAPSKASGGSVFKGNDSDYTLPPISLLEKPKDPPKDDLMLAHIEDAKRILQSTLDSFNVDGRVTSAITGPRVTRLEVTLSPGVKVEKVSGISNNIAMDLQAESIRILAPIPGRNAVGVEIPNKIASAVYMRSLMETPEWKESRADIPVVLGKDVAGRPVILDLAKAPHLLIAGSTGSGKSVCMNTLIMSLLFRFSPSDLRLILVDPKVVELEMYTPLPHLITPVVNDPKKVPLALRWGVAEMEKRYRMIAKAKTRNLAGFNSRPPDKEQLFDDAGNPIPEKLPLLVIIVDELADIMMTDAKSDVETSIARIAQKGRAAGIHIVIATQRPSVNIITGVIKANLPTRIAFRVTSITDSRVILDQKGAETLLGKGDMLFVPPGSANIERMQGAMVADPDIQKVVEFVSSQVEQDFDNKVVAGGEDGDDIDGDISDSVADSFDDEEDDGNDVTSFKEVSGTVAKYLQPGDGELVKKALEIILSERKASTSYLQRRLTIGYNKAAELIETFEKRGIVSAPLPGGQKRDILVFDEIDGK